MSGSFLTNNLDNTIVVIYLIITLIIGYTSGRKLKDLKEFAVYERNYPTIILVSTIFATMIGGSSTVGDVGQVFDDGIVFIILPISYGLGALFVAECLSGQIKKYYPQAISVGEILKFSYDVPGQVVTGICSVLFSIVAVAAQVFAIGYLFHYFFGVDVVVGAIIGYSIIIAYSSFGGINGVVRTDAFQFFILIVAIPMVASEGLSITGGYEGLLSSLPESKFAFLDSPLFFKYISLSIVFCFLYIHPAILQRVLISPSATQGRKSFIISATLAITFAFVITLIGLQGYVIDPTLEQNSVLFYMVKEIMPVGLKGITITGLIAAIMSTADSSLNTASIAAVNDIFQPIFKKKFTAAQELSIIRYTTFFIGLMTVLVVLKFERVLDIVVFSIYFWSPIILVPLYAAIWGYALSMRGFWICVSTGIIGSLSWILYFGKIFSIDGIVPIVIIDIIVFCVLYRFEGKRLFT